MPACKILVALLNASDHFVRFSRVLLVVQGRYWYRMKGLFKLYNNGLPCVSSIYYRFTQIRKNTLMHLKCWTAILFFSRVLLIVEGRYWYQMKGLFKLYNNGLPFVSSISNGFHANEEKLIIAVKICGHFVFCRSSALSYRVDIGTE